MSNLPVPDPTVRTTEALEREIAHLNKRLDDTENRRVEDKHDHNARTVELKQDNQREVAAAFAAAKGSAAKSEEAVTKQLDEMKRTNAAEIAGLVTEIAGLKVGINRVESRVAAPEQRAEGRQAQWALIVSAISVVVMLLTIVGAVIALTSGGG